MKKRDAIRMAWNELYEIETDPYNGSEIFVGIDGEIHVFGDTLDYWEVYYSPGDVRYIYPDGTIIYT